MSGGDDEAQGYGADRIAAVLAGITTLLPLAFLGGSAGAALAIRRGSSERLMNTGIMPNGYALLFLMLVIPLAAWALSGCCQCWCGRRDGFWKTPVLTVLGLGGAFFVAPVPFYPLEMTVFGFVGLAIPVYAALRLTTLGPAPR